MNKSRWVVVGVLLLVLGSALATGCNIKTLDIGELRTDSETVELGSAQEVTAEIMLGAGKLAISGGSNDLLEAQFTYNVANLKPEVSYDISAGNGQLTIEQPDTEEVPSLDMDKYRYEWDLRLNDDVPMDLAVKVGAGESRLALNSLLLSSLKFENGAGDVEIDLSGSAVRDLDVRMGAGDVHVDLSGNWQQDLAATIKGGVGKATVILPTTAGVRATVRGGLGQVNADALNKDGDVYTNDAYGQSDVTLDIEIEGGVGEINLVFAE
jgi:hypothetical protein